jgi:hypothetical protein
MLYPFGQQRITISAGDADFACQSGRILMEAKAPAVGKAG